MFTFKFYQSPFADGSQASAVVSAKSYKKYLRPNGSAEVIIYDSAVQTNGVSYQVSAAPGDYQRCYVENLSGKTVDSMLVKT